MSVLNEKQQKPVLAGGVSENFTLLDETIKRVIEINKAPAKPVEKNPSKNRILLVFWLISLMASGVIALNYPANSQHFFGIASSVEKTISFQYPVEIVDIYVVEGEKVAKGQPLLRVRRYDLSSALSIVEEQITEIIASKNELEATANAEVKRLEGRKRSEQSALDIDIGKIRTQIKLNAQWQKANPDPANSGKASDNLLDAKLSGLIKQRMHISSSYQATIDNLNSQLNNQHRPDDAKLTVLQKRKHELERQASTLQVTADFSGAVGSVSFAVGEQVEKFNPILTLHGERPHFVKAYIHEAVSNEVRVGQAVWAKSQTLGNQQSIISGRIASLGNRIVEYPLRLKRSPLVSAWGREIIVELDADNPLLVGEKVVILMDKPPQWTAGSSYKDKLEVIINQWGSHFSNRETSRESGGEHSHPNSTPLAMQAVDDQLLIGTTVEASGLAWDPQSQSYWMISDESDDLFELNQQAEIIQRHSIAGMAISDVESISLANDTLTLLASSSFNKKGEMRGNRSRLVQLKRKDKQWLYHRDVDLVERLRLLQPLDDSTRTFIDNAFESRSIDIEAHQILNNELYLGFKSPQTEDQQVVIIKIADLDALFSSAVTSAEIIAHFQLLSESNNSMLLTDMLFWDGRVYLTAVDARSGIANSGLWEMSNDFQQLESIAFFDGFKAEGVAIDPARRLATLLFDGGEKSGSYVLQKSFPFKRSITQ